MKINFEMGYNDLEKICPMLKDWVKLEEKEKIFVKITDDEALIRKIADEIGTKIIEDFIGTLKMRFAGNKSAIIAYREKMPIAIAIISIEPEILGFLMLEVKSSLRKKGISTLMLAFCICLIRDMQIKCGTEKVYFFDPKHEIRNLCEEKFGFLPRWDYNELNPEMVLEWASDAIDLKKLDGFIKGK